MAPTPRPASREKTWQKAVRCTEVGSGGGFEPGSAVFWNCGALIPVGHGNRCAAHAREREVAKQERRKAQGYTRSQGTRVAKAFLAGNPVCVRCRRRRSTIAHHKHGL